LTLLTQFRSIAKQWLEAVPAPRQRLPEVIQFPVNDICNSRCQMCNIWMQKRDNEVSAPDVRRILGNRLFRQVNSVGINGGEPTLRKDLPDIVSAIVETLPGLKGVSLITNGIQVTRINDAVDAIADITRRHGVHLDVMISLDGVGDVHDRVRGRPGNFASAVQVMEHAGRNPNVASVRIGCTIIRENVYGTYDLLDWCRDHGVYARFRVGIPHPRLYSDTARDPFMLDEDERYFLIVFLEHLITSYERDARRRAFYASLRDQLAYGSPRKAGCSWKHKGVTLTSRGELLYCAVASRTLGNTLTDDAETLFWSNAEHLDDIVRTKCNTCLHDYDGVADRQVVMRSITERILRRSPLWLYQSARSVRRSMLALEDRRRIRAALRHGGTPK
jgi:MoaA/NifB/PqqE/SkfB family radical SAM enzyme